MIFQTSDGVDINYKDSGGPGPPVLLVHGWAQTQEMFKYQYEAWQAERRVITFDLRGHGRSAKPPFGYRIARLAQDMKELIDHLELGRLDMLAWAMGAMVAWSYIDQQGTAALGRLVIIDQSPVVAATPWMPGDQRAESGANRDLAELLDLGAGLAGPQGERVLEEFERGMFSGQIDDGLWQFVMEQVRSVPTYVMLPLLVDLAAQDWRDLLPRLSVPTLVVGCEGSLVPVESLRSMAKAIPGARFEPMPVEFAGSHAPFLEGPAPFNEIVGNFLWGGPGRSGASSTAGPA